MQFRDRRTQKVYACILRNFQHFGHHHSPDNPPNLSTVQQWLKERSLQWPLHMVYHRARLVDRFLGWMQGRGIIPSNPLADLRCQYRKGTATIVRGLISDDVDAALEKLRPLPRFGSFLGRLMDQHVTLMRSAGYRYDVNERILLRFDHFLQGRPDLAGAPLTDAIDAWNRSNPSPQHLCEAAEAGRLVSKALHRLDPTEIVLSVSRGVRRRARQHDRQPYIYSEDEIRRILQAALALPSPKAPLRPLSLYTMVILAYCIGLRLGEIASLTVADVDEVDGTLEICETKFFKARRLPLPSSVMAAIKCYLAVRQESGAPTDPASGLFWQHQHNCPYSYGGIANLLVKVLRCAGLKPSHHKVGPRIHDLRHAMVNHRMQAWYRDGINPQSRLPYLATYLGHKDINSTLVYLHTTQEVMQEASARFRRYGVDALGAPGARP
jgi:integrase